MKYHRYMEAIETTYLIRLLQPAPAVLSILVDHPSTSAHGDNKANIGRSAKATVGAAFDINFSCNVI